MRYLLYKNLYFVFALLPCSVISQNVDSLNPKNDSLSFYVDSLPNSFYISGGVSVVSNYNGDFINYLYDNTPGLQPKNPAGNITPNDFSYKDPIAGISFFGGIELISAKYKWLHHQLELGFIQTKGNYSYTSTYSYTTPSQFSNTYTTIYDDVNANYLQNVFTMSYKFQPCTRYFFASLGVNAYMNFIKVTEQMNETKDVFHISDSRSTYTLNQSTIYNFSNLPFQIGGGCFIRTKKYVIKPALYFTPCPLYGYNYYTFSVSFGYRFKRLV